MTILFIIETLFIFCRSCRNLPLKRKESQKGHCAGDFGSSIATIAAIIIAILVIFLGEMFKEKGTDSQLGTQVFLVYGLGILFVSIFLSFDDRFSNFIQKKALYYSFYSLIGAILSIYVGPKLDNIALFYQSLIDPKVIILFFSLVIVMIFHLSRYGLPELVVRSKLKTSKMRE